MQNLHVGYEDSMYRLNAEYYIVGILQRLPVIAIALSRRESSEYFQLVGFSHVAYLLPFEHDYWALASALLEWWRSEFYTFHLPGGEMTITLKNVFPDQSDTRVGLR
ncbi:hypothetical protein PIB30_014108 [Stylosanthes scabra]|uniref:Aminotransferase-like plant mobile domain-containing protein n=1 Tax=Stylosanthes scabra TaxID=79078 RepID=A0ABU6S653_9FABA|nr:hypothetical protein [Stylosanthes scabra]